MAKTVAFTSGESPSMENFNKKFAEIVAQLTLSALGAAPAGYGLGGAAKYLTADDDINNIWQAGWYAWDTPPKNAPTIPAIGLYGSYQSMLVMNKGGSYTFAQLVVTIDGFVFFRNVVGGASEEWGILNPPMNAGVEFRTTERYLNKPVYVKLVDFGAFPNSTLKQVEHGCTNVGVMISCIGHIGNATANNYPGVSAVFANPIYIRVDTDSDFSAFTGQFILKYTKTTD